MLVKRERRIFFHLNSNNRNDKENQNPDPHIAPITPDCQRSDGRDMSQRKHLGGVTRLNEKSLTRRTLTTQKKSGQPACAKSRIS